MPWATRLARSSTPLPQFSPPTLRPGFNSDGVARGRMIASRRTAIRRAAPSSQRVPFFFHLLSSSIFPSRTGAYFTFFCKRLRLGTVTRLFYFLINSISHIGTLHFFNRIVPRRRAHFQLDSTSTLLGIHREKKTFPG